MPDADTLASPCNQVCRVDAASGWCLGCARTLDEIAHWSALGASDRQTILAALPQRQRHLAALGVNGGAT